MLMSSILLSGCIVRPAAKTIVSVKRVGAVRQERTFGLRDAYWIENIEGVHFVAFGWHHREHETYWFFINEPYPAILFRKIVLVPIDNDSDKTTYRVEAQLSDAYIPSDTNTGYDLRNVYKYEGQMSTYVNKFFDSRTVKLSDIKLYPKDESMPILLMDGKITAQLDVNNEYQRILNREH
jgi:hypothetical protein